MKFAFVLAQSADDSASALCSWRPGVGFDSGAELLIVVGDNANRIHSDAAFTNLCDVAPIPTGSGKTSVRHRLNCGGAHQANASIYRIVVVRIRVREPTIASVQRRTAEGLRKKDIIRCLKRVVARAVYRLLVAAKPRVVLQKAA